MRKPLSVSRLSLTIFAVVGAGILLLLPSWLNGSPFLYFDSAFYILHGLFSSPSWAFLWRPLTYSFFLHPVLTLSPRPLLLAGELCFTLAALVYFVARRLAPDLSPARYGLLLVGLAFTPFIYYANFILPDVFAGFVPLALGLIALERRPIRRLGPYALLLVAAMMHYSNLALAGVMILLIGLCRAPQKLWPALALGFVLPCLLIASLHYRSTGDFTVTNVADFIFYSRLQALGIADGFLTDECPSHPFKLCQHRELQFNIWKTAPNDRIGQVGGLRAIEDEVRELNGLILLSPHGVDFFIHSWDNVIRQWTDFYELLRPVLNPEHLGLDFQLLAPAVVQGFRHQRLNSLEFGPMLVTIGFVYLLTALAALLDLSYALWRRRLEADLRLMFFYALLAYALNGMICGFLTDPTGRYSGRMIWIFPFLAVLRRLRAGPKSDPLPYSQP
jgi:hypothetical protein